MGMTELRVAAVVLSAAWLVGCGDAAPSAAPSAAPPPAPLKPSVVQPPARPSVPQATPPAAATDRPTQPGRVALKIEQPGDLQFVTVLAVHPRPPEPPIDPDFAPPSDPAPVDPDFVMPPRRP